MKWVFHLLLIFLLCSCPNEDETPIPTSGLRENAKNELMTGNLKGALNFQLSAPRGECNEEGQFRSVTYTKERPSDSNTPSENEAICTQRAQWAKSQAINTLTVSFEGLGTYNDRFNKKFYNYYDALWEGKNPKTPTGFGSHVSKNLITPNLKNDYRKSDFLAFSEKGGSKTVQSCVAIYKRVIGPAFKLNIVGLSFGAGEALVLSEKLSEMKEFGSEGLKVDNLMTMDLRGSARVGDIGPRLRMNGNFQTPGNVKKHMNFGRFNAAELAVISPTLGYPGYRSRPSGVPGTQTTNHLMKTLTGHAAQVKTDVIQNYYQNLIP
ncbi:MAG: hypothetical protein NXH75_08675 [Halobacteriovoraceae bacterium]|nr:hypothetical protein [Halobacteriovoraceae bacterium]